MSLCSVLTGSKTGLSRSIAVLCSAVASSVAVVALLIAVPEATLAAEVSSISAAPLPAPVQSRLEKLQAALKTARAAGDAAAGMTSLNAIGDLYFNISEFASALDYYNQALVQARAVKDAPRGVAAANGVAGCYVELGRTNEAEQTYRQAYAVATSTGDLVGQATALNGAGRMTGDVGQWNKALQYYEQALALARKAADDDLQAAILLRTGLAYGALGSVEQAKENAGQALAIFQRVGDQEGQAKVLGAMAVGYKGLQDNQKALELGTQALGLYRQTGDRRNQAAALQGLSTVYQALGQPQRALESLNEALPLFQQTGDHAREEGTLISLGTVYGSLGQFKKAQDVSKQALEMARASGNRQGEVIALDNLGLANYSLGERQQALDNFNQALPLARESNNQGDVAATLNNIGLVYGSLGEGEKALDNWNLASQIYGQSGDSRRFAVLSNMGMAYMVLGNSEKALEYFNEVLQLYRSTSQPWGESLTLDSIGFAYGKKGDWQKSLEYLNQALALQQKSTFRAQVANTLTMIGIAWTSLGQNQKALDALNQALPIRREVNDREGEAATLDKLGAALNNMGQNQQAQKDLEQALPIADEVGNPLLESMILNDLMLSVKRAQPGLAIFYGKQSVNLLQQVRGGIQGLDKGLQTSFLASKEDVYQGLADLLIAQGRLPEAQRVLDLLKQQEYQDYVRGETTDTLSPLALTPAEKQAQDDYAKSTAQIIAAGQQWDELNKISARTPEQEKQFKQLSDQLDSAAKGLDKYYSQLYGLLGQGTEANKQVEDVKTAVSALGQEIAEMPRTVAIYTLVGKDRTSIIVITGATEVARQYAISEADLNKKVATFEQALRDRSKDPRPAAQDLYKILMVPIEADLAQAHAETLVWSLDGVLRYVPMAALYDGKQYLVEKYNSVTITPASIAHLADEPDVSKLSAVAMGISHKYEDGLPALPAVVGELNQIVTDAQVKGTNGVLPGTILLDGQFTEKAMEDQLRGQHQVVHIASHFVFKPGDDGQSYLLLAGKDEGGNGFHLTVADFNSDRNINLRRTDLLTLSACETGMSGNASDGREVDGLGTTAQLKGAKAVMSSLWEVDDASTGNLMSDFYKRWADGKGTVTKVEALRQAQLDLLQGRSKGAPSAQGRGFVDNEAGNGGQTASQSGFAHPFYWAPFVLMGNWR